MKVLAPIAAGLRALLALLAAKFADIVGLLGLVALGRGLWLEYGQSWALIIVGGFLVAVSVYAAVRGNG